MNKLLLLSFFLSLSILLYGQKVFYYSPDGEKVNFNILDTSVSVKFKKGAKKRKLISSIHPSLIKNIQDNILDSINEPIHLKISSKNQLKLLKKNSDVETADYLFQYSDGTIQELLIV
jgi:hypothetical protein